MTPIDAYSIMACIAVGPLQCSQGGVPYNEAHINYWRDRALKAEGAASSQPRQLVTKDRPDPDLDQTLSVVSDALNATGE